MIAEKLHAVNWRNNKKSWFLKLNSRNFKDKIKKTGNNEHLLNKWSPQAPEASI